VIGNWGGGSLYGATDFRTLQNRALHEHSLEELDGFLRPPLGLTRGCYLQSETAGLLLLARKGIRKANGRFCNSLPLLSAESVLAQSLAHSLDSRNRFPEKCFWERRL
jgi:hypothetical protein